MNRRPALQRGAALIELLLAAPLSILLGLGTLQIALLYRAHVVLDYATFEAARTGAVSHALEAPMREELVRRLAPLFTKGHSETAARQAALQYATNPDKLRVRRIAPPPSAFDDWGEATEGAGGRRIPNAHLKWSAPDVLGVRSGLSLADANILRLDVEYLHTLEFPLIRHLIGFVMQWADPVLREHYQNGRFPLRAVATVRMQSDPWEHASSRLPGLPLGGSETDAADDVPTKPPGGEPAAPGPDTGGTPENDESSTTLCGATGSGSYGDHLWSALPESDFPCDETQATPPADSGEPGTDGEPCP